MFSGITANGAVQLYKDVSAAVPDAKLYGPDGVAEPGFADPKEGGIPADVANKVKVTVATWPWTSTPLTARSSSMTSRPSTARRTRIRTRSTGMRPMPGPLDTCQQLQAECTDKQAMIDALFNTKGRQSVLGMYDIDENGDTTSLTDYGVYTIKDGELIFGETVKAEGA